ncbi:GDSL esterase/lipase [Dichanthelium oligosanthes]|uniref:GDSL esterase/lipase n=1 Tax=Dichanthelium oligosanthes TaxID=888268 RepID=A0A1E5WMQ4_9POAL|nr:GDSL esterase/lipase [Dichanthelium oligosanthes]
MRGRPMATVARTLLAAFVALLLVVDPCQARPAPQHTAKLAAREKAVVDGITAIYNFGDSLSDTGNLLRDGATGMLKYTTGPPYGSAIGGATGRCSDGYLMIDLAKDLGLPLLNPYLDKSADVAHGVNFAVAGATALDTAALARKGVSIPHTNSSLAVQLQQFKDFMNAKTRSPQEIREKLANSLVMVGEIGGNDYNYAFSENKPTAGSARDHYNFGRMATGVVEAMALVPDVERSVTSTAREILDMGATRLVIPGNFPLGCVPSYMSAVNETDPNAYDANGCLAALNLFAQMHNVLLQQGIREPRRSYPGAMIAYADLAATFVAIVACSSSCVVFQGAEVMGVQMEKPHQAHGTEALVWESSGCGARHHCCLLELLRCVPGSCECVCFLGKANTDYFYAYVRMLRDAGKTGFDEAAVTKTCCGAGAGAYNFDMDRICGAPGTSVCARPDERISWDGVHLTQRAYRVMTDFLYHKGFASPAPVEFPRA